MAHTQVYESDGIRVRYDSGRCIHAAECVRGLPSVFEPGRRPWIEPGNAGTDDVAAVIRRCPTGALQYERLEGAPQEIAPSTNTLVADPDGPVYAHGDIEIQSTSGDVIARETRLALCRCGASGNKPYCDGAHAKVGFRDAAEVNELKLKPVEDPTGPLVVKLLTDGPLLLSGPFSLLAANLSSAATGGGCALCRCGTSANKPFCDGSHKTSGFADPGVGPGAD